MQLWAYEGRKPYERLTGIEKQFFSYITQYNNNIIIIKPLIVSISLNF